jgi:hypothetical protein
VVTEFSNVLPEELSVVPPERGIEFVIELVLGTAPMYRDPIGWLLSN